MGRLADRAFAPEALVTAWRGVLGNARDEGVISPGVARFERDLDQELARLTTDLTWGAYSPRDLTEVVIDEGDRQRTLHIPSVRDRVVERAVLNAISPLVDPELSPAAYAYRPGLGVADALAVVVEMREEGFGWVVRSDVDDCFPSVPVPHARRLLGALVDDSELLAVVDASLARVYRDNRGSRRRVRGLAQGCAISPLLANLVLSAVDERLINAGYRVVRYADDIVVGAVTVDDAWDAARILSASVMELGGEASAVMSFEEGFSFLGEDFGPRNPPHLTGARVEQPERKVLYVAVQGGRVRVGNGRLHVESADDTPVLDVPTGHVRRMVCFGAVGVSAGSRTWAMSNSVDVVFASRRGAFLGWLTPASGSARSARLRRQIAIDGTEQSLSIGRAIVEAKIRKQVVLLQRFGRRESIDVTGDAIRAMRHSLILFPDARTRDEIMGLEGAAAAAYFPALGTLMPDGLQFETRSRRPPLDVGNAALSFLYTILLGECVTALAAAGLDPAIGVLHADNESRPSLALDLLEELRPMIADQVVLSSARLGALQAVHARVEEHRPGILLTKAGRHALLDAYERRMLTRTRGARSSPG